MFRRLSRFCLIALTALPLMSFRLEQANTAQEKLFYDVRGAFVTARPDVPKELVIATDMLVDEAIRATVRSIALPRTIISVRIDEMSHMPMLIGSRHEAKVTVQAISVNSGEPIARGTFKTSIYLLDGDTADRDLAEKIADRISSEFRLDGQRRPTMATALFP
ncbi:hypothetical protein [Neorhizobium tomejilense]|uniref:hypothetical protein n=1 Tax=Neorhizobium tomejilense TaxID=2093828 RepID=UPI000CFA6146|nr:hypothetical protein [Neorhizobium tomejilense]